MPPGVLPPMCSKYKVLSTKYPAEYSQRSLSRKKRRLQLCRFIQCYTIHPACYTMTYLHSSWLPKRTCNKKKEEKEREREREKERKKERKKTRGEENVPLFEENLNSNLRVQLWCTVSGLGARKLPSTLENHFPFRQQGRLSASKPRAWTPNFQCSNIITSML